MTLPLHRLASSLADKFILESKKDIEAMLEVHRNEALRPLRALQAAAAQRHEEERVHRRVEEIQREAKTKALTKQINAKADNGDTTHIAQQLAEIENEGKACVMRRYETNDTTIEKMGELLNQNPNGLMMYRDEMTGWLRSLDRDGHEQDRAFYLESWDGKGAFTYDRIGRGTTHIEHCCVTILGGIQPGPLSDYVRQARKGGRGDDGLLQRFQLLVWPDEPRKWTNVDRPPDEDAFNAAAGVFKRLDDLQPNSYRRFTPDAQARFNEWREKLEARLRSAEHEVLEAHLAKYRKLVPALALIFHLVESGEGAVNEQAFISATAWGEYLESHAKRVYADAVQQDIAAARRLSQRLAKIPDEFTLRDIYRKNWAGLDRDNALKGVHVLEEHFWFREVQYESPIGRPTQRWIKHPTLRNER